MSTQFIEIAANTVIINFFGLGINVHKDYMENGYIAVDQQGTMYVYAEHPVANVEFWAVSNSSDTSFEQVLNLASIAHLPNLYTWYTSQWRHLCFPLSDFPVLRTA